MKIFKSMPSQKDFFERYASLTHSLTKISVVAQLITGVCELGILYALFYPTLNDVFPNWANTLSIGLSLFCASLLQIGLKKVFPYSVRAILFKRFKGLDLPFSIAVFVLTLALLCVSIFLSYKGSQDIGTIAVQVPKEKTTTATDSLRAIAERQANAIFTTDSTTIETKYKGKLEATQSEIQSRIDAIERQATNSRTASPTWSKELTAKATGIKAELKTKLAVLESEKASEIEAKSTERKAVINRATDRNDKEASTILTDNKTATETAKAKQKAYGGYIGYFTLFCYLFFLCTFVLNEIYAKGAGIESTPQPMQRHFLPSIIKEFSETAKAKIDYFFRSKIQAWANKTPNTPLPDNVYVLFDFDPNFFHNTHKVEVEKTETKVLKIPSKPLKIAATTKQEPQEQSRKIGFWGKNLEGQKEGEILTNNDTTKIVGGGKSGEIQANTTTIVGGTDMVGSCPNCLKSFVKNHKKHVYCCDECRVQYWEKTKGKTVHRNKTGKN